MVGASVVVGEGARPIGKDNFAIILRRLLYYSETLEGLGTLEFYPPHIGIVVHTIQIHTPISSLHLGDT
eukprot:3215246-Ditylum_brightwellii.AAC.1